MSKIATELTKLLSELQQPGHFYASGTMESQLFSLSIAGIGKIALPLLPQQADALIHLAEPAPFGRGEATILDTSVRNTKQISADQVTLRGKGWQTFLDKVLARVMEQLGVKSEVTAELYKLLVYETGGFFVNHRDTEKANGMFATMIIALPSEYTGGELRIEHLGQRVSLSLQEDDPSLLSYAAFYADCIHEVLPVTSGCRLVLVYNLCRKGKGALPKPVNHATEQKQIASLLKHWTKDIERSLDLVRDTTPLKLVYLLEHAYTQEGLSFEQLKNKDQAVAEVLIAATQMADCELFLALLTIEESGAAEELYDRYDRYNRHRRYHDYDDDDDDDDDDTEFEVIEVFEHTRLLQHWIHPQLGRIASLHDLSFADEEVLPPDCLEDLEPDEQYFHEATGNAGASFERTYRRAALVFWPKAYSIPILMTENPNAVLLHLYPLLSEWQNKGAALDSDEWNTLHRDLKTVISLWNDLTPNHNQRGDAFETLLSMVSLLEAPALLEQAINLLIEDQSNYSIALNPTLAAALTSLSSEQAKTLLTTLFATPEPKHLFNHINLTRLLIADASFAQQAWLIPLIQPLLQAVLLEIPKIGYDRTTDSPFGLGYGYECRGIEASQTRWRDLIQVFAFADLELGKQMVEAVFANPKRFDPYTLLLDSALLICAEKTSKNALEQYVIARCITYLDTCIAQPLAAPTDWTRDVSFEIRAKDEDAQAFAVFLRDPYLAEWSFKAIQEKRNNLSSLAQNTKSDVDMTTIKKGSPHILHFTKNQASYERRVLERKRDETYHKKLRKQCKSDQQQ